MTSPVLIRNHGPGRRPKSCYVLLADSCRTVEFDAPMADRCMSQVSTFSGDEYLRRRYAGKAVKLS